MEEPLVFAQNGLAERLGAGAPHGEYEVLVEAAGTDSALASCVRQAAPGARVVLIAGNGHVRRDLGVPHDLAALDAAARVLSVAFLELDEGRPGTVDAPYDAAWFTPRAERVDPCAGFKPPVANPG